MKAVLISIQPEWSALIANGEKTIEVRKTRPNIETPFKCYIYCTKDNRFYDLYVNEPKAREDYNCVSRIRAGGKEEFKTIMGFSTYIANGKVIGEFICDKITELDLLYPAYFSQVSKETQNLIKNACLTMLQAHHYLKTHTGYAWHISNLKIYDKPKELSEFATICEGLKPYQCDKCEYFYTENSESGSYAECCCNNLKPLKRPPQSWCYVEELNNERI